jgi:small-conductance mechanosensitive channel
MSEIHEAIEKAQEGEHGEGFNRRIALVIAILALFLSFSETLGKGAQTETVTKNIEASDLWAFYQAKDIRRTVVNVAADQTSLLEAGLTDPAAKAAIDKQIETWRQAAEHYESDPKAGNGRKELEEQAKGAEEERDLATAKYHHYELASAAFQVGIVLASAAVITGMVGLAWFAGALGVVGAALLALGLFAPHAVPLIASL